MKFALISVFLLASFAVALSLKCYTCADCKDDGKEETCASGMDKCGKVYGKDKDGKESTSRVCTNAAGCKLAEGICEAAEKADSDVTCKAVCCDSDLCNSGPAPSFSVLLVSLCSLFAVVSFFK